MTTVPPRTLYPRFVASVAGVCTAVALAGCELFPTSDPHAELDDQLEVVLESAASNGGLSTFILPSSNDLDAVPQDPANPLTPSKVMLGRLLFHETALASANIRAAGFETYACSTCHHSAAGFRSGRVQGIGDGGIGFGTAGEGRTRNTDYAVDDVDARPMATLSVLNVAYQDVMLWSGAAGANGTNAGTEARWASIDDAGSNALGFGGVEARSIEALRSHRLDAFEASRVAGSAEYRQLFEAAFPDDPAEERVNRTNTGLAIAAYLRTLLPTEAPFQQWLRGSSRAMDLAEKRGALVFFGKAGCVTCHTSPALSSNTFHALGLNDLAGAGVIRVPEADGAEVRGRGGFTGDPADDYAFKTPQLYNLSDNRSYGHGGSKRSIREMVLYKNAGLAENPVVSLALLAPSFRPLALSSDEIDDLVAFLSAGLRDPDLERFVPDEVPSGNCIPANDLPARADLRCD